MCGITGWVDWSRDLRGDRRVVEDMTATLAPRGPDAREVYAAGSALLGHSRLAVIDLAGGRQPMTRGAVPGEQVVMTFSGEIYNFQELRVQLRTHGHAFVTRSDTEVLLAAYQQWGTGLVDRLNGMYAFAIWDQRTRELLLVRDRLGIKPLYYAQVGGGFVFGSEPKALLAHPDVAAEVDAEGIAELMAVPRARTPGTAVYRGMRELEPGCLLVAGERHVCRRRYWALEARPHTEDFAATAARVRSLLEDIVERQVVADVPVGTLLSGGIDSSAVTALATRRLGGDLASYSVRPSGHGGAADSWRPSQDDPYARLVAEKLGIRCIAVDVSAEDLVEGLDRGLGARDLPGWGDLDTSMLLMFGAVRKDCTVALSGESADEVFGGYTWQLDDDFIGHGSFPWMYARPQPAILLREEVRRVVEPERYEADRYHEALAEVSVLPGEDAARRRQREVFHLGLTRWLGALLDRKDRMSMAVGLEVRVPFADHRLAEYLYNVPRHIWTHRGIPKALLRRASTDLLPDEVVNRAKSAYPVSRDPAYVEQLRSLVLDLVAEPDAPVFQLVDRQRVRASVAAGAVDLPGPITAASPAVSLAHLLLLNRWLEAYRVRVVA
ncbi:asparagine synthase (glutamine-hydrolyzing) [Saccharopolyspora spinosa]|uniref:asparagine synthase (glutamine-hydrolyzing) n=1 Tax=Saccharopolyspora spinosa TaxID=60894 RepID=A0A2N3Y0X0_SACSN|nr:asparagine synthase (glutamine-hydrolyzing) [Saccharopolyspora spinosa]PKW16550.1 asparagine synthase (glutamine-hydrolysing) [Saccharopolyspora spinosa]